MRPEQPARVTRTAAHLLTAHPEWTWHIPSFAVTDDLLLLAHTPAYLKRLAQPRDFDADTPYFSGIAGHARRAVAASLEAAQHALTHRTPAFALIRPPGHHATADTPMGFCYLNNIAIAALHAHRTLGLRRIAVWDFDAHHGNGTEAILAAHADTAAFFFASVHQFPGYPGTGKHHLGPLFRNGPIAPRAPRAEHMGTLRDSLNAIIAFSPDLILVSAGFDAYARDPITAMTLERDDFATLGRWLGETGLPAAALLEGGYSDDLPLLIDAFLTAWENTLRTA
jgi:acetoin utilization deacetylase AcuC-like enzyme